MEKMPGKGLLWWFPVLMFVIGLILFLQSFYLIIRHITNKKFAVIIEALLESNKKD
jgi:cytochrome c-type biogenesis protein CcmH/NrfF